MWGLVPVGAGVAAAVPAGNVPDSSRLGRTSIARSGQKRSHSPQRMQSVASMIASCVRIRLALGQISTQMLQRLHHSSTHRMLT
jgi:hypothetical protein